MNYSKIKESITILLKCNLFLNNSYTQIQEEFFYLKISFEILFLPEANARVSLTNSMA